MTSEEQEKIYQQNQKTFERDQRRFNRFKIIAFVFIMASLFGLCTTLKGQFVDTKNLFSEFIEPLDDKGSDTTEVIYVVLEEDFYEQLNGTQVDTIYYPLLKSFYGYHVQNWKPYNVVFYDLNWNIIHDPIHIKKRKLFKK